MPSARVTLALTWNPDYLPNPPGMWNWPELFALPSTQLRVDSVVRTVLSTDTIPVLPSELSAAELARFMYTEPQYEGVARLSCISQEWGEFPVRVVSLQVARVLADLPDSAKVFHIAFFPDRAEIWRRADWEQSRSKRWSDAMSWREPTDSIVALRRTVYDELVAFLLSSTKGTSAVRADAEKVADLLLGFGPTNDGILTLLKYPAEKFARLNKYREQVASITSNDNQPAS